MDFLDLLGVLLRRWYVALPVLALTAVAVLRVAAATEPSFETDGTLILAEPGFIPRDSSAQQPGATTPDGSEPVRSVPGLAALIGSDAARRELTTGSSASYEVTPLGGTDLLNVRAYGPDAAEIVPLLERVVAAMERWVEEVVPMAAIPTTPHREPPVADEPPLFAASAVVSVPGLAEGGGNEVAAAPAFAGRLLAEMMADPAARRDVLGDDLRGTFEFVQDRRNPGPFLELSVVSNSPEATLELFNRAVEVASQRLDALQDNIGASPASRIGLDLLRRPGGAKLVSGGQTRPIFTMAGLGAFAAFALALVVESLARRGAQVRVPRRSIRRPLGAVGPARSEPSEARARRGTRRRPRRVGRTRADATAVVTTVPSVVDGGTPPDLSRWFLTSAQRSPGSAPSDARPPRTPVAPRGRREAGSPLPTPGRQQA